MSDILDKFKNKKILIWGYGREGKSTEEFFKKHPVIKSVEVSEKKPEEIDLSGYDYIFKSPGIRLSSPVLEGVTSDEEARITSQTEIFLEAFSDRVIGITGTKGKSTTTSLIYHILKTSLPEKKVFLVGNIGVPCLDFYDEMTKDEALAVFELSCHQLAYTRVSPHIAVFLNLYEDHLDFYGDRATYFQAKRHITEFQGEDDFLYIGTDVPELSTRAEVTRVADTLKDAPMTILGEHNRYNASFAGNIAAERFYIPEEKIKKAIEEFPGLDHRLKFIGEYEGRRFYDDSISTIPEATIQAAESVPDAAVILVGGMDREIDYTPLIKYMQKNRKLQFICMYASGKRIYDSSVENGYGENLHLVDDLFAAVKLAKQITPPGGACILSPAAASYGYFKNFEERGDVFKELVGKIFYDNILTNKKF